MGSKSYRLTCVRCGKVFEDLQDRFLLQCDEDHGPSLLRSEYDNKQLTIQREHPGIFRYSQWLPIRRVVDTPVKPAVLKAKIWPSESGWKTCGSPSMATGPNGAV